MVEGLVDIGASMSVTVAGIVRELRIMHLVTKNKTSSSVITQTLGKITEMLVKVGKI
jgi:hypothetical protein